MVRLALRPDVGAVGAKLSYPDGSIQHAGVIIGINGVAGHAFSGLRPGEEGYFGRERVTHEYSAVTAACLAIRREVFDEVKGFDALRFPVNFNDVDLCLRIRALGYKVLYCASAELVHHESASRRNDDGSPIRETANESPRFRERWPEAVEDDPFYNPNLSLACSFELSVPPRPGPRRLRTPAST
jgi:GT2 family glycosyltransferase